MISAAAKAVDVTKYWQHDEKQPGKVCEVAFVCNNQQQAGSDAIYVHERLPGGIRWQEGHGGVGGVAIGGQHKRRYLLLAIASGPIEQANPLSAVEYIA